ncbi:MAG: SIMPL domain-containing protein [Pseudomonadota bacterium]
MCGADQIWGEHMVALNWGAAIGGIAVALGVGFAGVQVGASFVESKRAGRTVVVKGLAEREVEADVASWRVPFRGVAANTDAALATAERARAAVLAFARAGGIEEASLSSEPYVLRIERNFINGVERTRFVAVGAVRIRTTDVAAVADLASETQTLLDQGVLLGENDFGEALKPIYLFTGLNEIKPDLIAEATKAARTSADQFAADSGATLGAIARANQGVIRILPRDGDFDERAERNKIVRVVSTVSYYLED